MSHEHSKISEFDLLAYGDGRLRDPDERVRKLNAWLRHHPRTADALSKDRDINDKLRSALSGVFDEPVPERLTAMLDMPRPASAALWKAATAASIAISLGLFAVLGFEQFNQTRPDYAGFLDEASQEIAVLKPAGATPIQAPDISGFGMTAVSADEIKFKNQRLRRIIYLGPDGAALQFLAGPLADKSEGVIRIKHTPTGNIAFWRDSGIAYRVSANLSNPELYSLAEALQAQTSGLQDRQIVKTVLEQPDIKGAEQTIAGDIPPAPPPNKSENGKFPEYDRLN
jgi:anti-sigma factor RsiW